MITKSRFDSTCYIPLALSLQNTTNIYYIEGTYAIFSWLTGSYVHAVNSQHQCLQICQLYVCACLVPILACAYNGHQLTAQDTFSCIFLRFVTGNFSPPFFALRAHCLGNSAKPSKSLLAGCCSSSSPSSYFFKRCPGKRLFAIFAITVL